MCKKLKKSKASSDDALDFLIFTRKNAPDKFTRFAKVVFNVDTAWAGVNALESFIKECGFLTKMGQLKSTVEITSEALRQVADTCNIIKCNPRELDRGEIYQILMECM